MTTIPLRRGTTLRWRGRIAPHDLDGYTLTATARWIGGASDLDVRVLVDAPGWVEVSADPAETAAWPLRLLEMSVRGETADGEAFETETLLIDLQNEVTA